MKRLISVLLCVFVVLCTISVVATADWSTRKNTPQIVEDVTDGDGNAEDSAPSTPIYKNFLKNGDFRDGLNYWTTSGGVSVVNNSAHFEGIASFSQKIEINPTKTYTLTGKADLIDAFENWSYAYLRAVFYNASGVKVGNKMDVGSALLTYGIITNRLKGVDENGIFIRQFGAGTGVVIPEQATEMELFFEGSTERTIWMVDNCV